MNSWMYGSLWFKAGFREEVDKFIEAAKKHAMTLKESLMHEYDDETIESLPNIEIYC